MKCWGKPQTERNAMRRNPVAYIIIYHNKAFKGDISEFNKETVK